MIFPRRIEFHALFRMGAAWDDCLVGFIRRHPRITFYLPEPTSVARSRGINHPKVIQSIIISVNHTKFLLLK